MTNLPICGPLVETVLYDVGTANELVVGTNTTPMQYEKAGGVTDADTFYFQSNDANLISTTK